MFAGDLTVAYCDLTSTLNVVEVCGEGGGLGGQIMVTTKVNCKCCVEHCKNEEKGGVGGVLCNLVVTHVSEYKKSRKWGGSPFCWRGLRTQE